MQNTAPSASSTASEPPSSAGPQTPLPPMALAGVRILDLSRVLAGPWCTQTLADLGAEVIKVERPGKGDDTRSWGPPYLKDSQGSDTSEAAYYLGANRNKRSIAIDMAKPEGQVLIRRLAAGVDVLVENFKVGDLARYGLDPQRLLEENPALIICSITGFGQTGPYKDRAGYDYAVQGLGGLMSVTGERDELPGGGPQKVGVAVADLFTGMYASVAILAALRHRDATGQGQWIDMALLDTQVAMLANLGANYLCSGITPGRMGNAHQNIVPYQVFEAADGHLILAIGNDVQFKKFCAIADQASWAEDPRFASNAQRVRHRELLVPLIAQVVKTRSRDAWLTALEAAHVPCGAINNLAQTFADPQVQARGMCTTLAHPLNPELSLVASPIKMSATPVSYRHAPPLLGQHSQILLREAGLSEAEIDALLQAGVVA